MTAKFVWKSQYETGIPIIDEQHKRLFVALDQVQDSVVHESPKEEIRGLVLALMADTREHFRTEEAIMAHHGFPDLLAHIRARQYKPEYPRYVPRGARPKPKRRRAACANGSS